MATWVYVCPDCGAENRNLNVNGSYCEWGSFSGTYRGGSSSIDEHYFAQGTQEYDDEINRLREEGVIDVEYKGAVNE